MPNYFTQTLLRDYVEEKGVDWDVVFNARGHFAEPHDGTGFGIGTLEVRKYLAELPRSRGRGRRRQRRQGQHQRPERKFRRRAVHRKGGLRPAAQGGARSPRNTTSPSCRTKGMSVTAARELADQMCHDHDIPLLLFARLRQGRLLDLGNPSARYAALRI